jgi:hypothetical protein
MALIVEFCGERFEIENETDFTIGRDADLVVDDNPFLHRRFLQISRHGDLWWISNIGSQLAATIADEAGIVQSWLAPGARIPLVFEQSTVWFTAGPTTYEFTVHSDEPPFMVVAVENPVVGSTTYGRTSLTPEQRMLLIALAEPMLRRRVRGAVNAPSSAEAAERLGWTITKFNRKLDHVCQKLAGMGVRGLHGGPDRLAKDRKSRLVEYALAARLVAQEDLVLLEGSDLA